MKKSHLILLAVTVATAFFSAYSLSAVNYIYKLDYQWYSQHSDAYSNEPRNFGSDEWYLSGLPKGSCFKVFTHAEADRAIPVSLTAALPKPGVTEKYFLIFVSLGKVNSLEYGIKIAGLAQRGNVIEVKLSLNSPYKKEVLPDNRTYRPCDLVRVPKSELAVTGQVHFVFKNQYGTKVYETHCKIY